MTTEPAVRIYLDLTHLGRHVTGIERVAIEQFERVRFENADIRPVRSSNLLSMLFKQQILLPLLAVVCPKAKFIFPGFPPSPVFAFLRERTYLYVHDAFLITRRQDLSLKARLYMAPQFRLALKRLKYFLTNSEKTRTEIAPFVAADAAITLYRPSVANLFKLSVQDRFEKPSSAPLKLVSVGTVEPRKNYAAAIAILDELRAKHAPNAELHIVGRPGWGNVSEQLNTHPALTVHGYLPEPEAKRVLEDADLYLCTSHDEGLGLPLIEAQYAGLPIVAPDKPVFHEALGASGMFINVDNAADAAEKIHAMTSKANWRRNHAVTALANVERWNRLALDDRSRIVSMFAANAVADTKSANARTTAR